jgi:uncharacterized membrane protein
MEVHDQIDIEAPRDAVFELFRDLEKAPRRVSGIERIEILEGPSMLDVGTRWRETRKMFGKEADEVMWATQLVENTSYQVEAESRGTRYETEYTFEDTAGGTRVSMTFRGTPISFPAKLMNVVGSLFAGTTRKMLHADLVDLKAACESQANPPRA